MENFRDLLREECEKPVVLPSGGVMSPIQIMVKSVKNNAMKGDLASIAFIDAMMRDIDQEKTQQKREAHAQRVQEKSQRLVEQLKNEGAYDGQDTEIAQVAEIAETLDRLNEIMADPEFQMVTTDFKSGRQTISLVIALRDKQRELFQKEMQKLRDDAAFRALRRKQTEY